MAEPYAGAALRSGPDAAPVRGRRPGRPSALVYEAKVRGRKPCMPLRESKIAPAFFIGLGGCGGAIVDELARKVKQEDSYDRYRDLLHFFAFDTDADDLARLAWIDTAHRFLLSDFHKPEYVDMKQ